MDIKLPRTVVDIQVSNTGTDKQQAGSDLPLTDFERSMERLQNLDKQIDLTSVLQQLEENYKREREGIYQSGFDAGLEAGREEKQMELQSEIEAFTNMITEFREHRWRLDKETELNMVQLVLSIARRTINRELQTNPAGVESIFVEVLEYVQGNEVLELSMHPDDLQYLETHSSQLDSLPEDVKINQLPGLDRGSCILQTSVETIDASIETKLDQIAEQLYTNLPGEELN